MNHKNTVETPNFVWFIGVVESRADPDALGRCKVRCVGYHTEDKQQLPTDDLPWATPMQPITSAANSEVGTAPVGPVEGTWVVGFFQDGENAQQPIFMGTIGGIPLSPASPDVGFNDPSGTYPTRTGFPDTPRLAYGNKEGTSVEFKESNIDEMLPASHLFGEPTLPEPAPPYNASYPYNHITQTESGHLLEMDDTPGAERINILHRSGSFDEYHPDGSRVQKILGDGYEIVANNKQVHVRGTCYITVDGDSEIYTKGDCLFRTDGNQQFKVQGDCQFNVGGKFAVQSSNGASRLEMSGPMINLNPPYPVVY